MHRQRFTSFDLCLVDNGGKRCCGSAPQCGSDFIVDSVRQNNDICVSKRYRHQLGKSTASTEANNVLTIANSEVATATSITLTATHNHRRGDPIANFYAFAVGSHGNHSTGKLMTRDVRQCDDVVSTLPAMPVRTADAAHTNFYDDAVGR